MFHNTTVKISGKKNEQAEFVKEKKCLQKSASKLPTLQISAEFAAIFFKVDYYN